MFYVNYSPLVKTVYRRLEISQQTSLNNEGAAFADLPINNIQTGAFGDVFHGHLTLPANPQLVKIVTIEILSEMASEQKRLEFLTKADLMRQFDNINVIYLEGIVTTRTPYMIITEYAPYGSLLDFLRVRLASSQYCQLVVRL